ncbi:MAG TPA: sigma-70 family RNA polymerase sigma factor [Acidimicrobiales bacterium]|jgi:RNA polymerase sigma-70 factor (ECF subfamily)|nr:sigma-70 family RNA polymerase sigma factor [Acidimicrobiales bacterium]
MREVSDDALLAGYGAGDREAAVAFVRRFQHRVFGVALAVLHDPALAEDVAQEAFVRAWRHAAAYDARRGPVAPWLLTITRNLAIDVVRSRRLRPVEPDDLALLLAAPGPGPGEQAETAELAGRVRRALLSVPVEQRRAVMLAAYGGRTAQEVSETESVPLGTAKTRIRSGLIRLRAALQEAEQGSAERGGGT